MINLKPITKENYKEVLKLSVSDNQTKHVATTEKSLALAYVYRDCTSPFAIYNNEVLIGFIMCRYNKEYSNYFIWQFLIDSKYQNKGYGKTALLKLLDWIKQQNNSKEITTTVTKGNNTAEKLYRSIGFTDIDSDADEEIDLIYKI